MASLLYLNINYKALLNHHGTTIKSLVKSHVAAIVCVALLLLLLSYKMCSEKVCFVRGFWSESLMVYPMAAAARQGFYKVVPITSVKKVGSYSYLIIAN